MSLYRKSWFIKHFTSATKKKMNVLKLFSFSDDITIMGFFNPLSEAWIKYQIFRSLAGRVKCKVALATFYVYYHSYQNVVWTSAPLDPFQITCRKYQCCLIVLTIYPHDQDTHGRLRKTHRRSLTYQSIHDIEKVAIKNGHEWFYTNHYATKTWTIIKEVRNKQSSYVVFFICVVMIILF